MIKKLLFASLIVVALLLAIIAFLTECVIAGNKQAVQIVTLLREQNVIIAMSEALQVEYDISPAEADCYARIYRKWARLRGVEWTRLAAVTYIESHFDPTLTSHAGAQGLMQLMKPTREWLCEKRNCSNGNTTPWRDVLNLDLGCEHLSNLIKKHGDTLGVALYNVGECNKDVFKVSQKCFTDSVFKYDRKLSLIFEGVRARSK